MKHGGGGFESHLLRITGRLALGTARASAALISRWRSRKARSSSRLRRSQPVTSALHLLALHDRQTGTMLASVYRPPRESASTQSRCSGVLEAPQ